MDWTPVLQALMAALAAVITALVATLTPVLKGYIAAKLTAKQRQTLATLAGEAVHMAQLAGLEPAVKKEQAVRYVTDALAKHGITLDEAEVSDAIEAALGIAKDVFAAS